MNTSYDNQNGRWMSNQSKERKAELDPERVVEQSEVIVASSMFAKVIRPAKFQLLLRFIRFADWNQDCQAIVRRTYIADYWRSCGPKS
jgi:hypothetical protein